MELCKALLHGLVQRTMRRESSDSDDRYCILDLQEA